MDLASFCNLIRERTGIVHDGSRLPRLRDAISLRMSGREIDSRNEYLGLLLRDPIEFGRLVSLITINETYFYREPSCLRVLSERLIPELLRDRAPGTEIKLLSAGCSTGEEPYSLAIEILEKVNPSLRGRFRIVGADIDSVALSRAAKGVYEKTSFRSMSPDLKAKYFEEIAPGRYEISAQVRSMVSFESLNLLSRPYPALFSGMDVIFFRNVSIYFDAPTQREIFERLSRILNPGGFLFLAAAEVFPYNNEGMLSLVRREGAFFYRKGEGSGAEEMFREDRPRKSGAFLDAPPFPFPKLPEIEEKERRAESAPLPSVPFRFPATESPLRRDGGSSLPSERKDPGMLLGEALELAKGKDYDKALELIETASGARSALTRAHALKANILVNLGRLEEAEQLAGEVLEADPMCLESYLLLGLIAKLRDKPDESLKRFKEALYVRPSCWLAHFSLAEIHHLRGDGEMARREYGIVERLLESDGFPDHGLPLFSLPMPLEQVARLCRHRISGSGGKK